jgi:hypothetical protein
VRARCPRDHRLTSTSLTGRSSGRQHRPCLRHSHGLCRCPTPCRAPAPLTLGVRPLQKYTLETPSACLKNSSIEPKPVVSRKGQIRLRLHPLAMFRLASLQATRMSRPNGLSVSRGQRTTGSLAPSCSEAPHHKLHSPQCRQVHWHLQNQASAKVFRLLRARPFKHLPPA